jgi:hypothetical protein
LSLVEGSHQSVSTSTPTKKVTSRKLRPEILRPKKDVAT